jgi:cytochrome c-type biogenesis protein CcmF
VFIVGVTLVKGYETERDVRMAVGDTVKVGSYTFRFDGVRDVPGPNYSASRASVDVAKDGKSIETLHPEKRIYFAQQMPMTEAAIDSGFLGDIYVSLGDPVGDGSWAVRVYDKPFIIWIWFGCILMAFGGFLALSDRRYRVRDAHAAAAAVAPGATASAG